MSPENWIELVRVAAWPSVVVLILLLYGDTIRGVLGRLTQGQVKDIKTPIII